MNVFDKYFDPIFQSIEHSISKYSNKIHNPYFIQKMRHLISQNVVDVKIA